MQFPAETASAVIPVVVIVNPVAADGSASNDGERESEVDEYTFSSHLGE